MTPRKKMNLSFKNDRSDNSLVPNIKIIKSQTQTNVAKARIKGNNTKKSDLISLSFGRKI